MKAKKEGSELFIGLVGAVGTNLQVISQTITKELSVVGYKTHDIKLSSLMGEVEKSGSLKKLINKTDDERIKSFMDAGNKLRSLRKQGDAVALLALEEIRRIREENDGSDDKPAYNNAYILNSLKHPDEIERLRSIYGDALLIVSIYSPKHVRRDALKNTIITKNKGIAPKNLEENVEILLKEDEKQENIGLGQNVRETFPLADIFIDANKDCDLQIKRFIKVLFGDYFTTPTLDEQSMFFAYTSSLRSADLSRQVGAMLVDKKGNLLATGCNEVPQAGGGIFWEDSTRKDFRDWRKGRDYNVKTIRQNIEELGEKLRNSGILSSSHATMDEDQLTETIKTALKGSGISSAIEYGRVVHAEMHAISDAAKRGISTLDATIYCTTFPCHMCARHIIASGIQKVVFIEPYPKSLTKELYDDLVIIDQESSTPPKENAIQFDAFMGISPRRYISLFHWGDKKRKDDYGMALVWDPITAIPKVQQNYGTHLNIETLFSKVLNGILPNFDVSLPQSEHSGESL